MRFFVRRNLFTLALFAFSVAALAQTVDTTVRGYCVRYEKKHLFLQKDSGFNVVDYDLEWPEVIDYGDVVPLKRYVGRLVSDCATTSLDSVVMSIGDAYGEPVTGMFKTIPDDDRFCYVTISAQVLSYKPGRWIAYSLKKSVEPQKRSVYKRSDVSRIIVYDLVRGEVMLADDMLRSGVGGMAVAADFYDRLTSPLSDEMFDNLQSSQIGGVWIDDGQINFLVDAVSVFDKVSYTVSMPYADYKYVLAKKVRNMVEKDVKPRSPQFISLPVTFEGDTVYNKVERMPVFKGGDDGLRDYLSHVGTPNVRLAKAERVYLSFVVDKSGRINDVSVVSPVMPQLDRYAVGVVKGMPPFTPGSHGGNPVCVRMYLPVNYKP